MSKIDEKKILLTDEERAELLVAWSEDATRSTALKAALKHYREAFDLPEDADVGLSGVIIGALTGLHAPKASGNDFLDAYDEYLHVESIRRIREVTCTRG